MAMSGKDRYILLSKAVRIANTAKLSYLQRLKTLARFVSSEFSCISVSIYLCDEKRRYLNRCVSTGSPGNFVSCHVPVGEGVAGRSVALRKFVSMASADLHPDELLKGTETSFCAFPIYDDRAVYGVLALGCSSERIPAGEELELLKDILVLLSGVIQRIDISTASQRRIANLTMLGELGALLNRSASPEALIPIIIDTCHKQSHSCCTILRMERGEWGAPRLHHRIKHSARRMLSEILSIEDLCSAKVRHSKISLLINDLISDDDLPPSYICIPLKFEDRLIGTLTFFGKRLGSGRCQNFTEMDLELFEGMAMLISNAIAGAASYQSTVRLGQENDQKLKELTLLYRLSSAMLSTIRLNKLMHLILSSVTSGENPLFDRAMLFMINERAEVMQGMLGITREASSEIGLSTLDFDSNFPGRWDISDEEMSRQQNSSFSLEIRAVRLELDRSKNMSSRAVFERRIVLVPDTAREKRVDPDFVRKFGVTSFVAMPLLAKDQVIGVVILDNPISGRPISQEDLRFLQLFANQAWIAIDNSLLYNRIEETNRRLRDAQERLLHGERLATIGEMAAGIAHELKSPLVSIGGFARRLQRKLPKGSDEAGCVTTIVSEVDRLEKMLSDILSFSRKSTLCYTVCNINEVIDEALGVTALSTDGGPVTVTLQYPKKVLPFLGDCQQLKQVFINLFNNAQEAMQGVGELKVTVTSGKLNGNQAVVVKVSDTGGGIPLASLSNIFNPFFTTKDSGTGLGLPIANRIVTNHGGKLQVNNYPGVGVEFTIMLPLEPPSRTG